MFPKLGHGAPGKPTVLSIVILLVMEIQITVIKRGLGGDYMTVNFMGFTNLDSFALGLDYLLV
jgi:hypothetical protein